MRFAVISDIHSNLRALRRVLDDIKDRGIENLYCTGDLIGYLTDPNGVVDLLRESSCKIILGNHDEKYIHCSKLSQEEMTDEIRNKGGSFLYTNQTLTDENRAWLKGLPKEIINDDMLFVHGSPYNISEYMYDGDEVIERVSKELDYKYVFFGHTHIPYNKEVNGVHFINPGSVGKPKHGNSKSSYVEIVRQDFDKVIFHQVDYDVEALADDIRKEPLISDKLVDDLRQIH